MKKMKPAILNKLKDLEAIFFDFDGVFTDNRVIVSDDGHESVVCWRSDGLGLAVLRKLGIKMAIISTEPNKVVAIRAKKLQLPCIHNTDNKLEEMVRYAGKNRINLQKSAFVGNDINDLECLKRAGVAVVVNDSYPQVKKVSDIVLTRCGGFGAVREFCEMVAYAKQSRR